jgi:putative sterol carrier protein/uncharacterized OB-fold protein
MMAEYFGSRVDDIFGTMPERFKPEGVKGVDVLIGYDITGDGGGKWVVTIKDATLKVDKIDGELPKCAVTLSTDAQGFVGGALGKIDTGEAFSSGRLKVAGDITALLNILPKAFSPFTPVVRAKAIIESMPERFRADKADGVSMKIGYDLSGADGGKWTVEIKNNACALKEGIDADNTVTLIMSAEIFVGLNTGKVDPGSAFSSGQIKIDGDMMAAGATAKLFTKFEVAGVHEKQGEELISLKCVPSIGQRFATGTHMGKWFAGLKIKKFFATSCPVCGRTQVPPREVCAVCRVRTDDFIEVGPNATVTIIDKVYFASPDPLTGKVRQTPYAALFMVMDGSTPTEGFAHDLKREDFDRIKPGMKIRPVWNENRTGSFHDLLYFEIDD